MKIAITGGIADGKSTALGFLRDLGFQVLDADAVVGDLYEEESVVGEIKSAFGQAAVSFGRIEREWLHGVVFSDAKSRRKLNQILHSRVIGAIVDWSRGIAGISFAEVPLLIETAAQGLFDRVWVVSAGYDEQLRRVAERFGGDRARAARLLQTQLPTEVKSVFADEIFRSDTSLEDLRSHLVLATRALQED
ncbi:MAG: dephospho-CoA kinase [Armatimonadetes bacterium]|nr:dephospho-CoA kinase [Armatimonadota bacterium]